MHDCRKVKVAEEIVQDYHKKKTKTTRAKCVLTCPESTLAF